MGVFVFRGFQRKDAFLRRKRFIATVLWLRFFLPMVFEAVLETARQKTNVVLYLNRSPLNIGYSFYFYDLRFRNNLLLFTTNWSCVGNNCVLIFYCVLICCVFQPAFGCCAHPKADPNTYFQLFSTFFFILNL